MAAAIKLSDVVVWGSSGAGALVTLGTVISCNKKSTVKQHEETDDNGEVHVLVLYDQREEVTLEILAGKEAVQPATGSTITIGGVTDLIVTEAETVWKRGDTKKFNVSAWKSVA
jgi:hypothetical protein